MGDGCQGDLGEASSRQGVGAGGGMTVAQITTYFIYFLTYSTNSFPQCDWNAYPGSRPGQYQGSDQDLAVRELTDLWGKRSCCLTSDRSGVGAGVGGAEAECRRVVSDRMGAARGP